MKKRNKKPIQFLVIAVLLVVLGWGYFKFTNSDSNKDGKTVSLKETANESDSSKTESKSLIEEAVENESDNNETVETEQVKEETPSSNTAAGLAKSEIMDYINKNVGSLAPAPPNAGIWKINRFWFTGSNEVYVEYSSEGELKQMLIGVEGDVQNPTYIKKAVFKSGESSWILESGEDAGFGKSRELYEKTGGQWVKKN